MLSKSEKSWLNRSPNKFDQNRSPLRGDFTPTFASRIEFLAVWPYSDNADEFVRAAVRKPGVGERSGLTAHFFFGAKLVGNWASISGI